MGKFIINGGKRLEGEVNISPAKNACLPLIASSILFPGQILFEKAPNITDVRVMGQIVENLGGEYSYGNDGLMINASKINSFEADCEICKRARASFFIAGALLSRFKKAVVPLPGGCNIGDRPVDIHISALNQLGAEVIIGEKCVYFDGANMRAGNVKLVFPSVGATVNAITASVFLSGETYIYNVAKEPEIVNMCTFLNLCGCNISGAGGNVIRVKGVKELRDRFFSFLPIKDRIEAGTFVCMVGACGGEISFEYDNFDTIRAFSEKLCECGMKIEYANNYVRVYANKRVKGANVVADVYPMFPTDLQSIYCALCATGIGKSIVEDKVFKKRFDFINELKKMGADVRIENNKAIINGVKRMRSASVFATDLRAGAGLVLAGLCADGQTVVLNGEVVKRGYEKLEQKLNVLGASITYVN